MAALPGASRRGVDLARMGNKGARFGLAVSCGIILVLIALASLAVLVTGGVPNPLAHLYYIPILYAAARHGWKGGLSAAIASGLVVGVWMPAPKTATGNENVLDWGVRLALFVVVALVASWLAHQRPQPLELLIRDMVLGRGLRAAVRHRRLRVHYQPLVDLADGRVIGVEALCRWNDSRQRPVAPDVFIPAAERTGAISMVGREVLRIATEQSEQWANDHGDGMTMSVNVSPLELSHPDFLDGLKALVGEAKLRRYTLCVEITETAIISDPHGALVTLSALREMGALIALDDFGTGHSSLAYLAGLPIDIIKIDQSFVATVDTDPTSRALVNAVVRIASALGATTIAEGIERPSQLRVLKELGCDIGQGYFLGRPAEAADVNWAVRTLA
ncbi:EAL domain-containing protein [Demequina lutea]|uniref:EAL domain-containing protein (Putative c-di-GMP-specific phosphodiesterase class I) n=1 Tax=Demequina lutea TaxID=431489 RepID=A0A7Y9ZAD7_9MICO|nr:EAL domain-containing protein [Demequina lutea]NYI40938.1 EAL domain-containing protein (putative c-di-GMP-specific phosphodiesterase class I) [Demequina lutea]